MEWMCRTDGSESRWASPTPKQAGDFLSLGFGVKEKLDSAQKASRRSFLFFLLTSLLCVLWVCALLLSVLHSINM